MATVLSDGGEASPTQLPPLPHAAAASSPASGTLADDSNDAQAPSPPAGTSSGSRRRGRTRARGRPCGSSPRGRGRARARGWGRGGLRSNRTNDPSQGWTISGSSCAALCLEQEFSGELLHNRARLLCRSAADKMKLECSIRGVVNTRCGFVVLFMNRFLQQLLGWLNERIRLEELQHDLLQLSDMYRYVAVLLLSHTSGFSFAKTFDILRQSGSSTPSLQVIRFFGVLTYWAWGRRPHGVERSARSEAAWRV